MNGRLGLICTSLVSLTVLSLVGCHSDPPIPNRERVPLDAADAMNPLPLEPIQDEPSAATGPGAVLPDLPPGGVIPGKTGRPENACGLECSCATVTLVRVETLDIKRVGGWFTDWAWHPPVRRYQLGDPATPPESGPLRFPARDLHDQVCFYFSYPACDAYWRWAGDNTGCTVRTEFRWPVRNSVTGERIHTWQLYGVQGWNMGGSFPVTIGDFRTGAPNVICLSAPLEGFQIPPGRGEVRWSVEGRTCEPGVEFEVTSR